MQLVNTNKWKKIPLTELFTIIGSTTTPKNELNLDDGGDYPYITTAGTNNGICGYSNKFTDEGNIITIDSATNGYAFYQKRNFTASDHVEKLVPKFTMNENIGLFIAGILNNTRKYYGYEYIEKRSQKALKNEYIILPINKQGKPDYKYMDSYIKKIKKDVDNKISNMEYTNMLFSNRINTSKWQRFNLYNDNLFRIDAGSKLDRVDMTVKNPTINFVGRANANNGVTAKVDLIKGLKPYDAGNLTISLGGEYLGSCFIQNKQFYTSQNVNVLIPKWKMSDNVKRFIAIMIFKEGRTYYKAFIDELNRHMKTDFSILLPITRKDCPDWNFMERFINRINTNTEKALEKIMYITT